MYERIGKRLLDVAAAAATLVVLAPVLGAVAAAIKLEDGGPVLFKQLRCGSNGRPFTFFKFRSMPVDTSERESAAAADLPVTRVGRVIRRLSIDELPQLLNVMRGEMSIVGPRPGLLSQQDLVDLRRANGSLRLRPGLTGLAQINAFDGMTAEEKARFDGMYAEDLSLRTDFGIIARTVGYLVKPPPTY